MIQTMKYLLCGLLAISLVACNQNTSRVKVTADVVSKNVVLPSLPSIMKRSHKTKQETIAPTANPKVNPEDHGLTLSTTPVASIQYQPTVLAKNNATNPYLPPYEEQPTQTKSPSSVTTATPSAGKTNSAASSAMPVPVAPTIETSQISSNQPTANNQATTRQSATPTNNTTAPSQAKAIGAINQNDVPAIEASQSIFTPQKEMAAPSAGITKAPIATSGQTVNKNVTPATTKPAQAVQPTKPAPMAVPSKPMQSQNRETVPASANVASKPVSEKPAQQQTVVATTPATSPVNSSVKKSSSVSSAAVNSVPENAKPAASKQVPASKPATPAVNQPMPEAAAVTSPTTKSTTSPSPAPAQKQVTLPESPKLAPPAPGSLNRPNAQPSNQALPSPTAPSGYNRPSYQRFNEPSNEAPPPPSKPKRPAPTGFDQVPVPVVN